MPIPRDAFRSAPEAVLDLREGTNAHAVASFLAAHPEQAFAAREVAEGADVDPDSVGVVLSRLEDRGLVAHRGRYWAIAEDERLASHAAAAHGARAADERFGPEEKDEWLAHAEGDVVTDTDDEGGVEATDEDDAAADEDDAAVDEDDADPDEEP
jgi:hypothetical protein